MTPTEPLPLHHSWPSWASTRFDLGRVDDDLAADASSVAALAGLAAGRWSCDLTTGRIAWSSALHRLFGFDRIGLLPARDDVLPLYQEGSRVAMERLRAHAIRHCRGFTLDIAVRSLAGDDLWVRLIAAPLAVDGQVVRLDGWKADVTHLYA